MKGGGYYDSGYVQQLDYFGHGARIPLIAVSKFTKPRYISHVYSDHASVVKFIEHNWNLKSITDRSRDNLPNPSTGPTPYVPGNLRTLSGQGQVCHGRQCEIVKLPALKARECRGRDHGRVVR